MAGTVSSATSSLASELLLNKIMNGQVQTSTGQTITAAGRTLSSTLGASGYAAKVGVTNMEYGEGLTSAAQNEISSLKDKLQQIKKSITDVNSRNGATGTDKVAVLAEAKRAWSAAFAQASGATYNGETLATSVAKKLNNGRSGTVDVLGDAINLRKSCGVSGYTAISTAAGGGGVAAALTAITTAINGLMNQESAAQNQIKAVQNEALLLSDQGANLDMAAASQGVSAMSGANNLLSSMLGGNQA